MFLSKHWTDFQNFWVYLLSAMRLCRKFNNFFSIREDNCLYFMVENSTFSAKFPIHKTNFEHGLFSFYHNLNPQAPRYTYTKNMSQTLKKNSVRPPFDTLCNALHVEKTNFATFSDATNNHYLPDSNAGAISDEKLPKSLTGFILTTLFLSLILAFTTGPSSTILVFLTFALFHITKKKC